MGLITKPKTWADAENVNYTDINSNFDTVYGELNGNVEDANVASGAAIAESKIEFNPSTGHSHDGTDSKAIPKGFIWTIESIIDTGTSVTPALIAVAPMTLSKWYLNIKTAPTGADLIINIKKNGTSIFNTHAAYKPTIADGDSSATGTQFDTTALAEGDILTIDVEQVGSTVQGSDLTITLKG